MLFRLLKIMTVLPVEIWTIIFGYLKACELQLAGCVCTSWKIIVNREKLRRVRQYSFGKEKWEKYFGNVNNEPPLPENIFGILESPCPFWSNKRIKDTHLLILIPKTVNDKPIALNNLGKLIRHSKQQYKVCYKHFYRKVKVQYKNVAIKKSYWILLTKDVIPNSWTKIYDEQLAMIKFPYTLPYALEVTICILMYYAESGKKLYSGKPIWTYTRCLDIVDTEYGKYPIVVGGFKSISLNINCDACNRRNCYGVSGLRKL